MSKKKLLNENTVRKFMKFANIGHLAEDFVKESDLYEDDEDALEFGDDEALDAVEDVEAVEDVGEFESEVGLEDEAGALDGVSEEAVEELVSVVAAALESATGIEIGVESGGAEEVVDTTVDDLDAVEDEVADVGDEFAAVEDEVLEEDVVEEDVVEEEVVEEEDVLEGVSVLDEEEITETVVRRVTKRLQALKNKKSSAEKRERIIESVAQKIIDRLS
jgi:hypothetical protein